MQTTYQARRKFLQWSLLTLVFSKLFARPSVELWIRQWIDRNPDSERNDFHLISAILLEVSPDFLKRDLSDQIWQKFNSYPELVLDFLELRKEILPQQTQDLSLKRISSYSPSSQSLIKKILATWYTGVFEHSGAERVRLFYEDALMFSAFRVYRPVPGECFETFGYWAHKPYETRNSKPVAGLKNG